jgi:2-iminoacetate synthase ThiH
MEALDVNKAAQNTSTVLQGQWLSALLYDRRSQIALSVCAVSAIGFFVFKRLRRRSRKSIAPESVNYHMTRRCNYSCGFCFHTAKTSIELPIDEAKRGLRMLQAAGRAQFLP